MFRSFDPENLSRLSGVYEGVGTATPLDTFTYGSNGLVSARTEGSGASGVTYGWDDINRLTSQSDSFAGGTGNVAWTFGYNPASQITTETRDNDAYAALAPPNGTTAYVPNGLNQYSSVGGIAYSYDANGNLTGDETTAYTYDIENRLVKAVAGGVTTNLVYDPLGRLFEYNQSTTATTRRFVTDGDAIVNELNGNNALAERFVHGSNAAADDPLVWYANANQGLTNRRWLHADHLGSIVAQTATDGSGGNPAINRYDEYGVPASSNGGRFQYTGQVWIAPLGLYYYKARFYSPGDGRFLQTDPVGYKDQINLYAYAFDDPVNKTDPSGLTCNEDGTGCKIDDPGKMTPDQRAKATSAYQGAVDKLLKDPNKSVTLRAEPKTGTRIGMSRTTTQGAMAKALIQARVTFQDQPTDSKGGEVNNRAQAYGEQGRTSLHIDLFPHFFDNYKNFVPEAERQGVTFLHEGAHLTEAGNDLREAYTNAYGPGAFDEEHQDPWNKMARDIWRNP